jgi:carbon storage regulator
MLVLTRKSGQKLIIDNNIVVTILETRGEAVKIGIDAPKTVSIYREEVYEEIIKANRQAIEETRQTQGSDLDQAARFLPKERRQEKPE